MIELAPPGAATGRTEPRAPAPSRKRTVTVALALCSTLLATGCGLIDWDGAQAPAEDFAQALAEADLAAAAELTDAPPSAEAALEQAHDALDPAAIDAELASVTENPDGTGATAHYELTWDLGDGRIWSYATEARLFSDNGEWTLRWAPAVLHPSLGAEHSLAVGETHPQPPPVLDTEGRELLTAQQVTSVLLDPEELADDELEDVAASLGAELSEIDDGITEEAILTGVQDGDDPHLVAALREEDFQPVREELEELPGVDVTHQQRLLAPTPDFGTHILRGLRELAEERAEDGAGWRVVTTDASGAEVEELHAEPPEPAEAVQSTLSQSAQSAAEDALEPVSEPGMVVALEPSTGELLAVAQNAAADEQGPISLTGRYPPGSTFKIVTAAAGLTAGELDAENELACPASTTIEHRAVTNDDGFDLGNTDLATAFARSCNTTFALLAADLDEGALSETAAALGLGAELRMPGAGVVTGDVPVAEDGVQRAENGFGQGTVLVSPFGMALASATIAVGAPPEPSLIADTETEVDGAGEALAEEVTATVGQLMREVVTDGTATELAELADVHGKTGTAQFGDGSGAHGWFAGYQGDVAFAVLVVEGGGSGPALEVTERFLDDLE